MIPADRYHSTQGPNKTDAGNGSKAICRVIEAESYIRERASRADESAFLEGVSPIPAMLVSETWDMKPESGPMPGILWASYAQFRREL